MITFHELMDKLAEQHDPCGICDLLKISSEDLVEAFQDKIEANFSRLVEEIE